jgi:hypothetical protein
MGLDNSAILFLCAAKSLGADFTQTLQLGRQSFFPSEPVLRRVFTVLGTEQDAQDFLRQNSYAESFFSLLGAQEISSIDYSSFESANILHDLNLPLPADLRCRFSVVYDGGTLEHVFNILQALKNAMEMVRLDGYFVQATVCNNFAGHGFWQFSPELIFRVFSKANGYRVDAVLLHEKTEKGDWYLVSDPEEVQSRVELCNSVPTYMMTIAKRIALTEIFAQHPQQSDYVTLWNQVSKAQPPCRGKRRPTKWRRRLLRPIEQSVKSWIGRPTFQPNEAFEKPYYRAILEDDFLHGRLGERGIRRARPTIVAAAS